MNWKSTAAAVLVIFALGYGVGAKFGLPFKVFKIEEAAAPQVEQKDGSTIIERSPTTPAAKPAHKVPKGSKVERIVSVKIEPKPTPGECQAKPITIDMTLVRQADGSKRVIASTPDGTIVGGKDIPVETFVAQPRDWAAGISFDPIRQATGVWLERNVSRFVVGVDLNQVRREPGDPSFMEGRLRVGFRF